MVDSQQASNTPRKRSTIERTLVWGLIIAGVGIALIEFRAQKGYASTLEAISNAYDAATKRIPMPEVDALMSGGPSRSVKLEDESRTHYVYSWFSIFRRDQYILNIIATKDATPAMIRFYEGGGADPNTPVPPANPVPLPPGGISFGAPGGDDNLAAPNEPSEGQSKDSSEPADSPEKAKEGEKTESPDPN